MRALKAIGILVAAVLSAGCNRPQLDAIAADVAKQMEPAIREAGREMARQMLAQDLGPTLLSSLVGATAPPGGPLCLLGTDAGWRDWAASGDPERLDLPVGLRTFVEPPRP